MPLQQVAGIVASVGRSLDKPPEECPQCGKKMRPDPICHGAHFCTSMDCDYAIIVGLVEEARKELIASERENIPACGVEMPKVREG